MPRKPARRPQVRHFAKTKRCAKGHLYSTHGLMVKDGRLPSGKQKWRLECDICRRTYNRKYFHRRND